MSTENAPPFFVIAGPTASGKSELAVRLAERCGGEIVGADAFQIYDGLDILTAKPDRELRRRAPHHLIGEVPLTETFDVAQFTAEARKRIAAIASRGATAIVCGGTGLYVRALIRGLADLPSADAALRAQLEALSADERRRRLAGLDPAAMSQIDLKNPRRVIRALEVCLLTGRPFTSFRTEWARRGPSCGVALVWDRAELCQRIGQRVAAMFAAGVEEEVRATSQVSPTAAQAIGFHEIKELLAGRIDRERCIRAIEQATRRYAKRQMTWFRRETALEPLAVTTTTRDFDALAAQLARGLSRE